MVVLQRLWNVDLYCEQCVFVVCFICRSWSCSWHCWSWLQDW